MLHATLIARRRRGGWAGVLLEGRSGAGKSDLALRAIAGEWRLVADDRVRAWTSGGRLYGRAPETLAGLIEARGVGVLRRAALPWCEIVARAECLSEGAALERVPEPERAPLLGVDLPRFRLIARETSALVKLEFALAATGL